MRKLTLKGFISEYVKELSFSGTSSITKLLKELDKNPRLKEPLILHAIISGMPSQIALEYPEFYCEYLKFKDEIGDSKYIIEHYNDMPDNYKKILNSYKYERDKLQGENQTKIFIRNKIIIIQQSKSITNYRIYTCLGMNHGNVNCFLKNGNANKISLESARKILEYVEKY